MGIPSFKYSGNVQIAMTRKPFGIALLLKVKEFMAFQGIKSHKAVQKFSDGCIIEAESVYGINTVSIYYPVGAGDNGKKRKIKLNKIGDYIVIKITAQPRDYLGTGTTYNPPAWSTVWDLKNEKVATGIKSISGENIVFPCADSKLDYWRDNKTDLLDSSASMTLQTFPDASFTAPWTTEENWGEEIFPTGYEDSMCTGTVYDYTEIDDYNYKTMFSDKYKVTSVMPLGDSMCLRRYFYLTNADALPYTDDRYLTGRPGHSHDMMVLESPLDTFEDFVIQPAISHYYYEYYHEPDDDPRNTIIVGDLSYTFGDWSTNRPTLGYYMGYSENSHFQLYVRWTKFIRSVWDDEVSIEDGWDTIDTALTKIQVHAGSYYENDSNREGAQLVDPLSLERNTILENAILNTLKQMLLIEDSNYSQDWSTWMLDPDHNTEYPSPDGYPIYTEDAQETYICQLLHSLSFSLEFRKGEETIIEQEEELL